MARDSHGLSQTYRRASEIIHIGITVCKNRKELRAYCPKLHKERQSVPLKEKKRTDGIHLWKRKRTLFMVLVSFPFQQENLCNHL